MQLLRIYHINRVMLEHGLDELIPAKWLKDRSGTTRESESKTDLAKQKTKTDRRALRL